MGLLLSIFPEYRWSELDQLFIELDGVVPFIADPPPLKLNQGILSFGGGH